MKTKLFLIMSLAASAFAANPTTPVGNAFVVVQQVKWGGSRSVALTSAVPDSVSDSIPVMINGAKPANSCTWAYDSKTNGSAADSVVFLVESKYCADPVLGAACDTIWVHSGHHQIYGNQKAVDSLWSGPLATVFESRTAPFQISAHNLFRLRAKGTIASAKTVTIQGKLICE